jgi:hypothetical protein
VTMEEHREHIAALETVVEERKKMTPADVAGERANADWEVRQAKREDDEWTLVYDTLMELCTDIGDDHEAYGPIEHLCEWVEKKMDEAATRHVTLYGQALSRELNRVEGEEQE